MVILMLNIMQLVLFTDLLYISDTNNNIYIYLKIDNFWFIILFLFFEYHNHFKKYLLFTVNQQKF